MESVTQRIFNLKPISLFTIDYDKIAIKALNPSIWNTENVQLNYYEDIKYEVIFKNTQADLFFDLFQKFDCSS